MPYGKGTYGSKRGRPVMKSPSTKPPKAPIEEKTPTARKPVATRKPVAARKASARRTTARRK